MQCREVNERKLVSVRNITVLDEESSTSSGCSGRDEVEVEDIFKISGEETQEINAKIPTAKTSTVNTPLTTSKIEGIQEILLKILGQLDSIKAIESRLEKIEKNQTLILINQSILSSGHSSITKNQLQIAHKLEDIEASIQTDPEKMALSRIMIECNAGIKKVEDSVCRMTGERKDKNVDEIASMLPMKTVEEVNDLETKIDSDEFSQAMKRYLYKIKGDSDDVSTVMREVFTDNLMANFNWEGTWNKQALCNLKICNVILADVFQHHGVRHFEKNVRKAVEKSHNRYKHLKRKKKTPP